MERYADEVDVCIVGGGPAGTLSSSLKQKIVTFDTDGVT